MYSFTDDCYSSLVNLSIITQFKFASTIITQLDIDETLEKFSVQAQSRETLWMKYPRMVEELRSNVDSLRNNLGANAKARLSELEQGELWSTVDEEADQRTAISTTILTTSRTLGGSSSVVQVSGKWVVKLKLASAPGSTETTPSMTSH